jgi:hypothetical protein
MEAISGTPESGRSVFRLPPRLTARPAAQCPARNQPPRSLQSRDWGAHWADPWIYVFSDLFSLCSSQPPALPTALAGGTDFSLCFQSNAYPADGLSRSNDPVSFSSLRTKLAGSDPTGRSSAPAASSIVTLCASPFSCTE